MERAGEVGAGGVEDILCEVLALGEDLAEVHAVVAIGSRVDDAEPGVDVDAQVPVGLREFQEKTFTLPSMPALASNRAESPLPSLIQKPVVSIPRPTWYDHPASMLTLASRLALRSSG